MSASFRCLLCVAALAARVVAGAQFLEVQPELGEVGVSAAVSVRSHDKEPVAGVPVVVVPPHAPPVELGATDATGIVTFQPAAEGRYEFRATLPDDVRLIALYDVRAVRSRWRLAMVCVPAGLVLLWLNVRRRGGGLEARETGP